MRSMDSGGGTELRHWHQGGKSSGAPKRADSGWLDDRIVSYGLAEHYAAAASRYYNESLGRIYCTHLDSQFLTRGIAMIRSLRRFDGFADIRVLALDSRCALAIRVLVRELLNSASRLLAVSCANSLRVQSALEFVIHALRHSRPVAETHVDKLPATVETEFGIGVAPVIGLLIKNGGRP